MSEVPYTAARCQVKIKKMNENRTRVLIIEDDEEDYVLVKGLLEESASKFDLDWVKDGQLVGLPDKEWRGKPNRSLSAQRGWRFVGEFLRDVGVIPFADHGGGFNFVADF